MYYLIARTETGTRSLVLPVAQGTELVTLKETIQKDLPEKDIQLFTVSRPSAYSEYEPFQFVDNPEEFIYEIRNLFGLHSH